MNEQPSSRYSTPVLISPCSHPSKVTKPHSLCSIFKIFQKGKKWLPLANFRITRFWNLESYFSTIKKNSSWLQKHLYCVYVLVSVVWNRETLWLRVIKAPHVHCQNQYKSIATYWGQSADSIFTVKAIILNHTKFNCKKQKDTLCGYVQWKSITLDSETFYHKWPIGKLSRPFQIINALQQCRGNTINMNTELFSN